MLSEIIPPWSSIKIVGSTVPAKVTLLLPIVANIVIFNDYVIDSFSGKSSLFAGVVETSGSVQIYLFWIFTGLLIFAVGEILFLIFCSSIVRLHSQVEAFLESINERNTSKALIFYWVEVCENCPNISQAEKDRFGLTAANFEIENSSDFKVSEKTVNIARLYYKSCDCSRPIIRFLCVVLLSSGLFAMYLPTLKTVWAALLSFFHFN